jgi:hypothetical protein
LARRRLPSDAEGDSVRDYLDREQLLALDLDLDTVDRLLAASSLSGYDGRPVVEAERLADLLAQLDSEGDRQ